MQGTYPAESQQAIALSRRAAAKFRVTVKDDPTRPSGLRLVWSEDDRWKEWAALTEGTYVLRSNVADWSSEELWQTYIQLHEAENAFRIQKSDLRIRPIWHQIEERVRAHILVCFLAFAMWKTLEGWQRRAGLGSSPRTVLIVPAAESRCGGRVVETQRLGGLLRSYRRDAA